MLVIMELELLELVDLVMVLVKGLVKQLELVNLALGLAIQLELVEQLELAIIMV